jgi:hypothetical protein
VVVQEEVAVAVVGGELEGAGTVDVFREEGEEAVGGVVGVVELSWASRLYRGELTKRGYESRCMSV